MQVKVVIGTIAFMLTMIIFGLATLLEPARLEETTEAFEGRQIEKGAVLFKNNCAECHGVEGKAESCADFSGEEKACVGLPLNHVPLLCGEPSERMVQLNWKSSKEDLIYQTIAAGRMGTQMPVWSVEYGGPMEDYQMEQLTAYVLNWGADPDLCPQDIVIAGPVEWPEAVEDLPEGNADNGPALYQSYACNSCHGDPGTPGSNAVGPHLGNIGNLAATRVEGQSAEQYIYESIYAANNFIVEECPTGPCSEPSVMAAQLYENRMSLQDMADLIAYYLTLTN